MMRAMLDASTQPPRVRPRRPGLLAAGVLLLLLAPLLALAQPAAPGLTTVILVRHAEKAGPSGDVPLSSAGRARATRLASVLRDAGVKRIYTSDLIRTRATAAPLATRLGLTPEQLPAAAVDPLVARLRALPPGAVALVVHHSNTVPEIAQKLGAPRQPEIAEDEYDRLLVLTRSPQGAVQLVTLRY
jgi:phosphohistidine phosphatase SixA